MDPTTGAAAVRYEYGPFGEPMRATGPVAAANPVGFSSKYTDEETGLVYYGYRCYNPAVGRWLSRDPLAGVLLDVARRRYTRRRIQTIHRAQIAIYRWAENDGLNRIDYLGLHTGIVPDSDVVLTIWISRDERRDVTLSSSPIKIPCTSQTMVLDVKPFGLSDDEAFEIYSAHNNPLGGMRFDVLGPKKTFYGYRTELIRELGGERVGIFTRYWYPAFGGGDYFDWPFNKDPIDKRHPLTTWGEHIGVGRALKPDGKGVVVLKYGNSSRSWQFEIVPPP